MCVYLTYSNGSFLSCHEFCVWVCVLCTPLFHLPLHNTVRHWPVGWSALLFRSFCINNCLDNYINLNLLGPLLFCYLWHAASWMYVESAHPLKCLCLSSLLYHHPSLRTHMQFPSLFSTLFYFYSFLFKIQNTHLCFVSCLFTYTLFQFLCFLILHFPFLPPLW